MARRCKITRLVTTVVASVVALSALSQSLPRLVVNVVIDGLQTSDIEQLQSRLAQGGFSRLMRDAWRAELHTRGARLDAVASTSVLMTGAYGSVTGVDASQRFDAEKLLSRPVFTDTRYMGINTSVSLSPMPLAATTITDELALTTDGAAATYAVAADPQLALVLGGHAAHGVYWLNTVNNRFATTSFYKTDAPACITTRNHSAASIADENEAVTDVALDLLTTLTMGRRSSPDMLNVGLSVRGAAGVEQGTLAVDRQLDRLLTAIDREVGLREAVVIVAGAGTPDAADPDARFNIPSGDFYPQRAVSLLNMYLMARYGNGNWVAAYDNRQIYLNQQLIKQQGLDLPTVRSDAATFVAQMEGVLAAYSREQVVNRPVTAEQQSLHTVLAPSGVGDVVLELMPGWRVYDITGTRVVERVTLSAATVPCFVLAPGLAPQRVSQPLDAAVLAPSVARQMHIRSPNAAQMLPAF